MKNELKLKNAGEVKYLRVNVYHKAKMRSSVALMLEDCK